MKKIFTGLFIAALFVSNSALAASKDTSKVPVLCISSEGAISLKSKCKKNETKVTNLSQLKGDTGATGPSYLLASAKISFDGNVTTQILGSGVTSITATRVSTGTYDVTINGSFPNLTGTSNSADNRDKVLLTTSAVAFGNGIATGEANEADTTHIKIRFFISDPAGTLQNHNGLIFSALLAQ